jgi:molecular chaperone HscB
MEKSLGNELSRAIAQYENEAEEVKNIVLDLIKDIYYRKKYLLRIRESIDKFATR